MAHLCSQGIDASAHRRLAPALPLAGRGHAPLVDPDLALSRSARAMARACESGPMTESA